MVAPHVGEIGRTITLPSFRILPQQEATLYAKVSGYLKTIKVDKGDEVREGELLAELEVPELLAQQAQAKAELAVAHTNFVRIDEARQRAPDLVVPQNVDDLRGRWEVAQAKLQGLETLLQYTRITAPFGGVVTARFMDPGAFVAAPSGGGAAQTGALVTLMDYRRVRVQVAIPETEVLFITNGVPAQLSIEELPGRVIPGSVTRFAHALDPATKTMLAEIELDNPANELRPGAYATVRLEVERKKTALLLPVQAVATEKSGSAVYVIAEGRARKKPVRIGFNDGTNAEILEGIANGQPVILGPKQAMMEGQVVVPSEAK
jgi:RND family efflux transporter MFP subunit